jgi:RNA polymerase sigma-70 factor (ECF subfamily)
MGTAIASSVLMSMSGGSFARVSRASIESSLFGRQDTPRLAPSLVGLLPDLHGLARQLVGDAARASDLVQDTCCRALAAESQFAPGTNLRAWLFCILRNLHRDRLRRAAREGLWCRISDDLPAAEPAARPLWVNVTDDDLTGALGCLSARYRDTYLLHVVDGLTYAEIGRRLDIASVTVGTRLVRARARLRSLLTDRMRVRMRADALDREAGPLVRRGDPAGLRVWSPNDQARAPSRRPPRTTASATRPCDAIAGQPSTPPLR